MSVQVAKGGGAASGTGFVVDADGTIVTNAHVVEGAEQAQVRFDDTGRAVPARILGTDPSSDLAVLSVDKNSAPRLRVLPLADSDKVRVGDSAIAIGYPLGLDRTATAGIISGLGREIQAPNGFTIDEVIQTDAPINPGNSGGPLIDANGRVIGVNSQIATAGSQGNVGIGFAVPANTVREIVPQLKGGQSIARPYLGVSTSPALTGRGAVVQEVTPGGPAQDAGIKANSSPTAQDGDVIVGVDGRAVTEPDDVAQAIEGKQPGDEVSVRVKRDGTEQRDHRRAGQAPGAEPDAQSAPARSRGASSAPCCSSRWPPSRSGSGGTCGRTGPGRRSPPRRSCRPSPRGGRAGGATGRWRSTRSGSPR